MSNNLLYDLGPWLAEGKDGLKGDSFIPAFLNQYLGRRRGRSHHSIPVSADSTMLFYNKSLFEKAGVTELPTEQWTYDDLYRVARADHHSERRRLLGSAKHPLQQPAVCSSWTTPS